jgi:hypothetical protein
MTLRYLKDRTSIQCENRLYDLRLELLIPYRNVAGSIPDVVIGSFH